MRRLTACCFAVLVALLAACAQPPAPPPPPAPAPVRSDLPKLAVSQTDRGVMIWLPDNVLFAFGKADLSADGGPYLDRVAQILTRKTDHALVLEGHTDNVGAAALNQTLSERRAATVSQALQARGVPAARLRTEGFGLRKPLAPNDTETGRRLNRRVELIVLDETVERLMQGEPANSFESAVARLKAEIDAIGNGKSTP
jgi:outer membrane protein OmpA-like peptidoglycan-associated protein